jgi:hypothetical protein
VPEEEIIQRIFHNELVGRHSQHQKQGVGKDWLVEAFVHLNIILFKHLCCYTMQLITCNDTAKLRIKGIPILVKVKIQDMGEPTIVPKLTLMKHVLDSVARWSRPKPILLIVLTQASPPSVL